ncbi:AAA family ATPase [Corynebacterium diphtheriae]|uniref:AAA family ATPase n=1 Tax=Corynebacterium diphtheriae TaxID=1717 RepID=UPI000B4A9727|nr:AAA family ATPase [Corynebacterium diphtheriae]OWN22833.1 hypothetical protein AY495_00690 [Corynebacterium diphtheriae bv. mitis]OWN30301.1 hypothetical protein AY487_03880 [Corynebacterium diphtheriae bv. mitis]OWO65995.1 hypothetical protein AY483_08030 [Corynebacterium diphtheriae bv. mitis]
MLYVITGPPAAGKTTYVDAHAKQGDIRIDFDHIANLLSGSPADNHTHTDAVRQAVREARRVMIREAMKHAHDVDVWIIDTKPKPQRLREYQKHGAKIITLDPGIHEIRQRCIKERPPELLQVAENWYTEDEPQTTTQRGYGWRHQKARRALLAQHKDGDPCWWCGKPMWKDKNKNHDGLPLAADHDQAAGAKNHQRAKRLLHGSCNSQAKDHANDHQRPALQKQKATPAPPASTSFGWV